MFEISELVDRINPRQTILLLGAGASIPSGAPSGNQLAQRLARDLKGLSDPNSYTLSELCSIYERRQGRKELAEAVARILSPLEPTKGIQLLPKFDWHRIYSTNFDLLVEKVYRALDVDLSVYRSNFDFSRQSTTNSTEYYKIHGCITQDEGFGHQTRMLLTEEDYERYSDFREASFKALAADMMTKDSLIIGQSLADPHLRDLARETLKLHEKSGTPGRIFLLTYARDEERAQMYLSRGAEVYFGDLDSLFDGLLTLLPKDEVRDPSEEVKFEPSLLPSELISVTTDVRHSLTLDANPRRLFNGSPATYADISKGFTFQRSARKPLLKVLQQKPIAVILGAGGVGKTTLARQIAMELGQGLDAVWEHTNSFALESKYWIEYERRLQLQEKKALLVVDDCIDNLAQAGQVATHLGTVANPALSLILTANTGQWEQRTKSRYIFSHGEAQTLTILSDDDILSLIGVAAQKSEIRELVETRFLSMPRGEQIRVLRERCAADMYVCMKNIFASEELDFILLREYADLEEPAQEIYRNVAALDATGARVHRQLIMRTLGVDAGGLMAILTALSGIVTEYDIAPADGLFGWETRHREVAKTIARYKFAAPADLEMLFNSLIDSINPSVRLEREAAKALCTDAEFGIDKLASVDKQIELLRKIVKLIPGEGIPRHRLIRHLIDQQRLDEAAKELRDAITSIRMNPVLGRYEVLLQIRKAQLTPGLMDQDRAAILLSAQALALKNIERYQVDLHAYRIYGDAAVALADVGGGADALDDAISRARKAESQILDPAFVEMRRRLEADRRRISSSE
ncbi:MULTISPECIES: SIR2 family protein [unclassified Mycolicibacterium]|uniref:SIR2 family protein n=1 Tax=unclassified Mycolicibacterium TaxID=2636767 RepID=UPI002ED9A7BE